MENLLGNSDISAISPTVTDAINALNSNSAKLGYGLSGGTGGIDRTANLNLPVQIYTDVNGTKYTLSFSNGGMCYLHNHSTQRDEFSLPLYTSQGVVYLQDSATQHRTAIESVNGSTVWRLEVEADGQVYLWRSDDLRATWRAVKCLSDNLRNFITMVAVNKDTIYFNPYQPINNVELIPVDGQSFPITTHAPTGIIDYSTSDQSVLPTMIFYNKISLRSVWQDPITIPSGYLHVTCGWISVW